MKILLYRLAADANQFGAVGADFVFHFLDGTINDFAVVWAIFVEPVSRFGRIGDHVKLIKLRPGQPLANTLADSDL